MEAVTVRIALPAPVTEFVFNVALAPAGSPLKLNATLLLIRVGSPTFTVKVVFVPGIIVCDAGEPERENNG